MRTFQQSIVHGPVSSRHIAQLFDSLESRAEAVSTYLAEACDAGHNMLVVAKAPHWEEIAQQLDARGYDLERAQTEGRLVVLNALATLDSISRDGQPAAPLFERVVGAELRRLSNGAELSVYGELVELLAERGDFRGALGIEELWNLYSERHSFTLLCGYSSAHFVGRPGESALQAVCRAHARVHSRDDDPLGQWILQSSRG